MSRRLLILILLPLWMGVTTTWGEQRFPPPDFESGYELPVMQNPSARSLPWHYLDVGVLLITLGVASYVVLRHRSRKWIMSMAFCGHAAAHTPQALQDAEMFSAR